MNKKIILLIVILVFAVGVVAGAVWFLNSGKDGGKNFIPANLAHNSNKPAPTPIKRVPTEDDKENCAKTANEKECLDNGFYNWSQIQYNRIVSENNMEKCDELKDGERDSCQYSAAVASKNIQLCKDTSNSETCELEIIMGQNDWSACKTLADAKRIEQCQKNYITAMRDKGEAICETVPKQDKALCLNFYYYSYALGRYDYVSCRKITDPKMSAQCLSDMPPDTDHDDVSNFMEQNIYHTSIGNKDTDGDGLSDYDEIFVYKTDPLEADTDGDGFKDGEEVKNGYNPLVAGRLAQ